MVPRLTTRLTGDGVRVPLGSAVWADTHVLLPGQLTAGNYVGVFTGAAMPSGQARWALDVADLLASFPVAVLERKE